MVRSRQEVFRLRFAYVMQTQRWLMLNLIIIRLLVEITYSIGFSGYVHKQRLVFV